MTTRRWVTRHGSAIRDCPSRFENRGVGGTDGPRAADDLRVLLRASRAHVPRDDPSFRPRTQPRL